jgi:hypothetical protein
LSATPGDSFDCAGMRWVQAKAEALLHLRCIALNGDWEHFFAWTCKRTGLCGFATPTA